MAHRANTQMVALVPHTCVKGRGPDVCRHWHRLRFESRLPSTSSCHVMSWHLNTYLCPEGCIYTILRSEDGRISQIVVLLYRDFSITTLRAMPTLEQAPQNRCMVFYSSPTSRRVPIPPNNTNSRTPPSCGQIRET